MSSYSFYANHTTRAGLIALVESKMATVVAAQPEHTDDGAAAVTCASALVMVCAEPGPGKAMFISVSGTLGAWDVAHPENITGATCNVQISVGDEL